MPDQLKSDIEQCVFLLLTETNFDEAEQALLEAGIHPDLINAVTDGIDRAKDVVAHA